MHPDSPTWCAIMYRSEHESQVPNHPRPTYCNSDPSDRPSIDGAAGSTDVPKPFPSDLSCDCINSTKYTLSPLYFNSIAVGNEDRSVNVAKVQVSRTLCVLWGKVLRVDTKKKWKTHGGVPKQSMCCCHVGLREVTPDGCLGIGP